MKRYRFWIGLVFVAVFATLMVSQAAEAAWRTRIIKNYQFHYRDYYGQKWVNWLATYQAISHYAYAEPRVLIGGTGLAPGHKIKVYIFPEPGRNGADEYGGIYKSIGLPEDSPFSNSSFTKYRLVNDRIFIRCGTNEQSMRNLYKFGAVLAHETTHCFFTRVTRFYVNRWFWAPEYDTEKKSKERESYHSEALAWYSGMYNYRFYRNYYGPNQRKYTFQDIRSHTRSQQISWMDIGRNYPGYPSHWQLTSIGYYFGRFNHQASHWRVRLMVKTLRANYRTFVNSVVFRKAHNAAFGEDTNDEYTYTYSWDLYNDYYIMFVQ
ncbi:hypothetical protein ACFL2Q_15455 [Thermodesulfobacteriota bacterium]